MQSILIDNRRILNDILAGLSKVMNECKICRAEHAQIIKSINNMNAELKLMRMGRGRLAMTSGHDTELNNSSPPYANRPLSRTHAMQSSAARTTKSKYPSYCTNIKSCWGYMWEHEQKTLLTLFNITKSDIRVIIGEINNDIKISISESEQSDADGRKIRDALYRKYGKSKMAKKLLIEQKLKKKREFDQTSSIPA